MTIAPGRNPLLPTRRARYIATSAFDLLHILQPSGLAAHAAISPGDDLPETARNPNRCYCSLRASGAQGGSSFVVQLRSFLATLAGLGHLAGSQSSPAPHTHPSPLLFGANPPVTPL